MNSPGPAPEPGAPDHHIPLLRGWTLWPWIFLRGAGFPSALVLRLATERSAELAGKHAALEDECGTLRAAAVAACLRAAREAAPEGKDALSKLARQLRDGKPLKVPGHTPDELARAVQALTGRGVELAASRARLEETLEAEMAAARTALHELIRSDLFHEALLWQNRAAVHAGIASMLRHADRPSNWKTRGNELLVASYLQRYCVKNDTVGFFGPVGLARWSPDDIGVRVQPGADTLEARRVYFEQWAVDALAERLAADPAIRIHLAPRRMPNVRLEGTTLCYAIDRTAQLPAEFARVLAACDGEASPAELVARLAAEPDQEPLALDDVLELLEELAERRLITWTLELPTGDANTDRTLRALLDRVPDERARGAALAPLDRLVADRDRIAAAAGDPARLDQALAQLDSTFVELTGADATRRAGETYAGRSLVYEDCRRSGELEVGDDIRRALSEPLELLLLSARWYTYEIARRYRALFGKTYSELCGESGQPRIPLQRFRDRVFTELGSQFETRPPIVREVAGELRSAWKKVLGLGDGEHRAARTSAELAPAINEVFAAPHPGWPTGRFHSPDLFVVARDAAAIADGDYHFALGELHVGVNTLLLGFVLELHPGRADLERAFGLDRPSIGVTTVESKQHATRADHLPVGKRDWHLETGATRSFRPRSQVLAVADMVVEELDGALQVTSIDRRHRFDPIVFFELDLTVASASAFSVLASDDPHTPRVTVDRLVIAREAWRFVGDQLDFIRAPTPLERFIGAQRWRAQHHLPRFLFARVPEEMKPLYVDLASSFYVELLAKLARRATILQVSEMLPDHTGHWLAGSDDQRYTSELRVVAVDPTVWRPERG